MASTHSIQIVFVDSDGTKTNGPSIVPTQKIGRTRKFDDGFWSRGQTIRRFCRYLSREDNDGLEATIRALNRLDCWELAVDHLRTGPSPNIAKGRALLSFWLTYGLHSIPQGMREALPHLIDTFKYLLPPYKGENLTLYRGELESRHAIGVYGISWTSYIDKAREFANRRSLIEGRGVILKIEATPDLIIVALRDYSQHTLTLGEDEYLIDPRLISGKVSVVT